MGDIAKLTDIYYNAVIKYAQVLELGQSSKPEEVGGERRSIGASLVQWRNLLEQWKPDYNMIPGWNQSLAINAVNKAINEQPISDTDIGWAQLDLMRKNSGPGQDDGWDYVVRSRLPEFIQMLKRYQQINNS